MTKRQASKRQRILCLFCRRRFDPKSYASHQCPGAK